jgi:hypothetical protein
MGSGIHYHLMMRSNDPVLEAMLIEKTAADYVYIENSFYQVPIQCPLTTYHELYINPTTTLLGKVGGVLYEMFGQVIQRGDLRPLNRINNEPIWESHKHSQIMAQEQLIAIVNAGPYRSVMSQMLGVLVREEGTVTYQGHGFHLEMVCGVARSEGAREDTYLGSNSTLTSSTTEAYAEPRGQATFGTYLGPDGVLLSSRADYADAQYDYAGSEPPLAQVTYSTAGATDDEEEEVRAYDYVCFQQQKPQERTCEYGSSTTTAMEYDSGVAVPQTQTVEYDLMEDLMQEPVAAAAQTPEEQMDEVIRSFSNPETGGGGGIPKPSASSFDFY